MGIRQDELPDFTGEWRFKDQESSTSAYFVI
jgi:hypothetical protein